MLTVPKLDNMNFERIFERARSRIPLLSGEWTDYNYHDPGITTLHTFSWLSDTLNYYMDATGEQHRLKYLKLLGISPYACPARCPIGFSGKDGGVLSIPKGIRIAAGTVVFETCNAYYGCENHVVSVVGEIGGHFYDLTPFAGVDGSFAKLFTPDREADAALYLGFAHPLKNGMCFYMEISQSHPRNPFGTDFVLSKGVWEYFDGERWRGVKVISDETNCFLRSGFLTLEWQGVTPNYETPVLPMAHYLRFILLKNGYDILPRLGTVIVNCVNAVQTYTSPRLLEYISNGFETVEIEEYIRENDLITVSVFEEDGSFCVWYRYSWDDTSLCRVTPGAHPWQRTVVFSNPPTKGRRILVSIADGTAVERLFLGKTSGRANECIQCEEDDVLDLKLALVYEKDEKRYFELWEQCEGLYQAGCDDRVFAYDKEQGVIMFGDSINGMQTDAGMEVEIILARCSVLGAGNVVKGAVCSLMDGIGDNITAQNICEAKGGCFPQPSEELVENIEETCFGATRAVNAHDYCKIVQETPGLLIDAVNVITMREYADEYHLDFAPNTVVVAVKPYSDHEPRPVLDAHYAAVIRANLEHYRLLTTDIRVVPARFVGIIVYGRLLLRGHVEWAKPAVERELFERIDFSIKKQFGNHILYGKLFSALELLESVRAVNQLSFEYVGLGGHKNEHGDIELASDCLAYLQDIRIEYV